MPNEYATAGDDLGWLEDGAYSTAQEASTRLGVYDEMVRKWARAGLIRYLITDTPHRFLLCDEDIDQLQSLLHGIGKPTIGDARTLLRVAQLDGESRFGA